MKDCREKENPSVYRLWGQRRRPSLGRAGHRIGRAVRWGEENERKRTARGPLACDVSERNFGAPRDTRRQQVLIARVVLPAPADGHDADGSGRCSLGDRARRRPPPGPCRA